MTYDTVVVGGGAAGLSAAIYNGRYGHSTVVIQGSGYEGCTIETWGVQNYPGFLSVDGIDLVQTMQKQAEATGAKLLNGHVNHISKINDLFMVQHDGGFCEGKTVIYAAGTIRRKLGIEGEDKLTGKGISYCATCDGPIFRNKVVGVVGGGDSAAKAALILAQYTKKVYIIAREEKLSAEPINVSNVQKKENITILYNSHIDEFVQKEGILAGIKLHDKTIVDLSGLFVEIGGIPNVESVKPLEVELDSRDQIKVDCEGKTSVPGLFAAGDVTNAFGGFKQIITAAAGGSVASHSAHNFLVKKAK